MPHQSSSGLRVPLRLRLTLWVIAIFVVVQGVLGGALWWYSNTLTRADFNALLVETATDMRDVVEELDTEPDDAELARIARTGLNDVRFAQLRLSILRSEADELTPDDAALAARALASGEAEIFQPPGVPIGETGYLVVAVPLSGVAWGDVLVLETGGQHLDRRRRLVTAVLAACLVVGVLASAASGWFIAGLAVRPMHAVAEAAGGLSPETIGERIELDESSPEMAEITSELEASRERLREAFATQERFLSNISHELKTPIATLLLEAQTLDRRGLPEQAGAFVDSVEEEMRKLGRLVESFLTLTRVRDGGGSAHTRTCGANDLVMDAVSDCHSIAEMHGVTLQPTLADDDAGLRAEIEGDPELLRTLLNNLIRNAVRFTPRGDPVRVSARVADDRFVVDVIDSGPGIPPEVLPRLFDRFVQSQGELSRQRGHGLGLAIARGIAEMHGGDVVARNLDPTGACFTTHLPIARVETPGNA